MFFSLTTFIINTAEDSPVLYALLVLAVIGIVALAMHQALELLVKVLKL